MFCSSSYYEDAIVEDVFAFICMWVEIRDVRKGPGGNTV